MAADEPLVAVVMPAHDAARYVEEALDSVLSQSYGRLEVVVVDDGSTDGTWEILQRYAGSDGRVRVFRNEHNAGIVATRNRAFDVASADARYFAVLDSDDVCMPDRIAHQVAFMEAHPDHAIVGGHTAIIDEGSRLTGERRYPTSDAQLRKVIARYNPIAQPTVMIRRAALEAVGRYDNRYARCQDYDMWLRMAASFPIANLDEVTLRYRISSTQGKTRHLKESLRNTIEIQRRWLFHREFFSVYNLLYWLAEHGLLALPEPLILWLFKRLTYRGA